MEEVKLRLVVNNKLDEVPLGDPADICIDFPNGEPMAPALEAYELQAAAPARCEQWRADSPPGRWM